MIRTIAHLVIGLSLGSSAFANPPLDNRWVEFQKDNSHLGPTPTSLSDAVTETDLAWGDLDNNGSVDLVIVRKQPWTTTGKRTNVLLMNHGGVLIDQTATHARQSTVVGDGHGGNMGSPGSFDRPRGRIYNA